MDRHQLNIHAESAITYARGKRINTHSRVGILGVRGWVEVQEKTHGKIKVIIDGAEVWLSVHMACRIDILNKRIKTLCLK